MKIGCLDKSAAARLELQRFVDEAFRSARESIGHLRLLEIVPVTVDELLVNHSYDAVIIGPHLENEERYNLCQRLQEVAPLFLLFDRSAYSLRALKRFERVSHRHFCVDEPPIRLVHELCSCHTHNRTSGKLITLSNVKGGVGCTTLTAGLAHAAHSLGRTAVLVDLSPLSVLAHYLFAPKVTSPDHTTFLLNGVEPDRTTLERCIVTAPNGLSLLLPPSGGSETREQWLRDPNRLEISLATVEHLREMYDIVFVDCGSVEGVLPYALSSIAEKHLVVSSNEPASLHLLERKLLRECEGAFNALTTITMLSRSALSSSEVEDFLLAHGRLRTLPFRLLPFDGAGTRWIGSGNTLYTEASSGLQKLLEEHLLSALGEEANDPGQSLSQRVNQFFKKKRGKLLTRQALPAPAPLRLSPPASQLFAEHDDPPPYSQQQSGFDQGPKQTQLGSLHFKASSRGEGTLSSLFTNPMPVE